MWCDVHHEPMIIHIRISALTCSSCSRTFETFLTAPQVWLACQMLLYRCGDFIRTTTKCPVHHSSWASFIGKHLWSLCFLLKTTCFETWYTFLSCWAASAAAWVAKPSKQALLSHLANVAVIIFSPSARSVYKNHSTLSFLCCWWNLESRFLLWYTDRLSQFWTGKPEKTPVEDYVFVICV